MTPLQEHAKNLSFSQRKLLGIARALLTRKKIILLDEPFEGLSEEIIANIIVILHEMRVNHTIVVIAQNKQINLKFDKKIRLNAPL
jgi:ABC-type bacteriocin/lantibiotic exporter with double-glycine peptidase domain